MTPERINAKRAAAMLGALPWRTGRKVGRTLYDAADRLIGVMDTPELAAQVVAAVNAASAQQGLRFLGTLILPGVTNTGDYEGEPEFDLRVGVLDALQARIVAGAKGQTVRVAVYAGEALTSAP